MRIKKAGSPAWEPRATIPITSPRLAGLIPPPSWPDGTPYQGPGTPMVSLSTTPHGAPITAGIANIKPAARSKIAATLQKPFTDDDWREIERVRKEYFIQRMQLLTGISLPDLASAGQKIVTAIEALKSLLDNAGHDKATHEMWERIIFRTKLPWGNDLPLDDLPVYGVVSQMGAKAALALDAVERERNGGRENVSDPWTVFIAGLANVYRARGWDVAAAKIAANSGAPVSPFVHFVQLILYTLAPNVRAHCHSEAALSIAVYRALESWRADKDRPENIA